MARMSMRKRMEELREDVDKVLRQMCFGRAYREYCEGVITQIIDTAVIYDRCIKDTIVVDEDMVVTALMEIVFRDYEYEE